MTQDERAAFEAWATAEGLPMARQGESYQCDMVRDCWDGWQARAAIAQPAEPATVKDSLTPGQANAQPVAPEFDHSIGEERFRVVKGPFWWHILIGEGTAKVGKFRSKLAAEDVALKLLTAFRDGAYMQWQAAAPPARQPLKLDKVRDLVKECGLDWHRGFAPLFTGDETNRYEVLVREVERLCGIGEGE